MPRKNYATASEHDKWVNWISALRSASRHRIVLCEKRQDAVALARFGVSHCTWLRVPEYEELEAIAMSRAECILLLNVNKHADHKCEQLRAELEELGVKVNTRFRKILFTTHAKEVSAIQTYLQKHVYEERKDLELY